MAGVYPVRITVASQKGKCEACHKAGDSWLVENSLTPDGICQGAYNVIAPNLRVMRYGGEYPWSTDKDMTLAACPDAENPVVFEIRRLR